MERSSLRELLRATRELEEKSRANETLAFNLLHLGEDLRQTVENMRTVSIQNYYCLFMRITCPPWLFVSRLMAYVH